MFMIIVGLILSNIYCYNVLPRKEHEDPFIKITMWPILYRSMVIIPLNSTRAIHVHHWVLYMFILLFYGCLWEWFIGFCAGMIINGLTYADAFDFMMQNPYSVFEN